jgi:hypothetical protein
VWRRSTGREAHRTSRPTLLEDIGGCALMLILVGAGPAAALGITLAFLLL